MPYEDVFCSNAPKRFGWMSPSSLHYHPWRVDEGGEKNPTSSRLRYQSVWAAHLSGQFDPRDNIARFHLNLQSSFGKLYWISDGSPLPICRIDRHSRPVSSGINTQVYGLRLRARLTDWAWKRTRSRNNYKSKWGVSACPWLKMKRRIWHDGTNQLQVHVRHNTSFTHYTCVITRQ